MAFDSESKPRWRVIKPLISAVVGDPFQFVPELVHELLFVAGSRCVSAAEAWCGAETDWSGCHGIGRGHTVVSIPVAKPAVRPRAAVLLVVRSLWE